MMRFALYLGTLFVFWIFLSGNLDAFHLSLGLLSAGLVTWMTLRTGTPREPEDLRTLPGLVLRSIRYIVWLLGRIILAAIHVSKVILSPAMPIDPRFIRHRTILKSDEDKVIFANSITLTPGTITADIEGNDFIVHRLDEESSGDIDSSEMENQILRISGNRGSRKP